MATTRKCGKGAKVVTNKNGSTRSYKKTLSGKWQLAGYSGKAPRKRK